MAKAAIWCEVSCLYCGAAVGWFYQNSKSISNLKAATKSWIFDKEKGNLCPECAEKVKKGIELS